MRFYAIHDVKGKVLFDGNRFLLLKVEGSAFNSQMNFADIKNFPSCNDYRVESAFAPRYPSIIFLSKESHRYIVDNVDIDAIEGEILNSGDMDLQKILLTIKSLKGKAQDYNISSAFMAGHIENDNIKWSQSIITPDKATCLFTFDKITRSFTIKVTNDAPSPTGVFFINEFESIFVPLNDLDTLTKIWSKVLSRSRLDGRISGEYLVVPTASKYRLKVTLRSLKNMKTEEMLEFFGHQRKSTSKVETLSGCLESLTRRNVSNLDSEMGEIGLMQITTHPVPETPIEVPPVDWVLSRCAHFAIKYAEPVNNNTTNVFVETVDRPIDDIARTFYTMFEQSKKDINIAFFRQNALDKIFQHVQNTA